MLDLANDTIISLNDAAKMLPARRQGKRPSLGCLYRWTTAGCKGVVLESVQVGSTRCTTVAALRSFIEALTMQDGARTPAHTIRSTAARQRAIRKAEAELQAAGI